MSTYLVELRGESREVYYVEADSEDEARENWHTGAIYVTECYGMEITDVRQEEE